MKKLLKKTLRKLGYDLVRYNAELDPLSDLTDAEKQIIAAARPFTKTSLERMAALINSVNHVVRNQVPGDIVECGVWRGGSMMVIARTLLAQGDRRRALYLYDTFAGMSAPSEHDKSFDGVAAEIQLARDQDRKNGIWCEAGLEDVRTNLAATGYPMEQVFFVKGKVEDTIPSSPHVPPAIALLRLDTDWYESTKHELVHLYPRLNRQGVLIIDDYGHWQGARKAVDEYFANSNEGVFLHRIDNTGRAVVKGGR